MKKVLISLMSIGVVFLILGAVFLGLAPSASFDFIPLGIVLVALGFISFFCIGVAFCLNALSEYGGR